MSDYQPISCMDHERLEFAVLRRQKLRLTYRDEAGEIRTITVLPTDVATRDMAEWLTYRSAEGLEGVLRLDWIVSAVSEAP